MKVKQFKEFINKFDDDFDLELNFSRLLKPYELEGMIYPYPYENITMTLNPKNDYDIGYSDKVVCLFFKDNNENT